MVLVAILIAQISFSQTEKEIRAKIDSLESVKLALNKQLQAVESELSALKKKAESFTQKEMTQAQDAVIKNDSLIIVNISIPFNLTMENGSNIHLAKGEIIQLTYYSKSMFEVKYKSQIGQAWSLYIYQNWNGMGRNSKELDQIVKYLESYPVRKKRETEKALLAQQKEKENALLAQKKEKDKKLLAQKRAEVLLTL